MASSGSSTTARACCASADLAEKEGVVQGELQALAVEPGGADQPLVGYHLVGLRMRTGNEDAVRAGVAAMDFPYAGEFLRRRRPTPPG